MSKITYTTETLYHFNCHSCGGWWSMGDAPNKEWRTCPHCGFNTIAKPGETTLQSISSGLAAKALEEAINEGKTIEIPSLGIKIEGKKAHGQPGA